MNIAVIDVETSKKPIFHPWQKDAYLSTIGLKMYHDSKPGEYQYFEWVWYHNESPNITQEDRLQITFELQEQIDRLEQEAEIITRSNIKLDRTGT